MNTEISKKIHNLEKELNILFPKLYSDFLEKIAPDTVFEPADSGVFLYSITDLMERNNTYEIQKYAPDFFMIGQDGDLGFFIKISDRNDDAIYSLGLGAVGSLPMRKQAENIELFIENIEKEFD